MSELLLNDETLTTADIANPERAREVPAVAIDDRNLQPVQSVPATSKAATIRLARYSLTMNCITSGLNGIRPRPRSWTSPGRQ